MKNIKGLLSYLLALALVLPGLSFLSDIPTAYATPVVAFKNSGYTADATSVTLGNTAYIEVDESTMNIDTSTADAMWVTLTSGNSDSETVLLTESGANTGIFRGSITTAYLCTADTEDGTLQSAGGSITATFRATNSLTTFDDFQAHGDATPINSGGPDTAFYTADTEGVYFTLETDKTKYIKRVVGTANVTGMSAYNFITYPTLNENFGTNDFTIQVKLSDPSLLSTTGYTPGGMPTIKNFNISIAGEADDVFSGAPSHLSRAEFTASYFPTNKWVTLTIPQSAFSAVSGLTAINWSAVDYISVDVVTGNGTSGAASPLSVSMDVLGRQSITSYTDTITGLVSGVPEGGSPSCAAVNNIAPSFTDGPVLASHTPTITSTINNGATTIPLSSAQYINGNGGSLKIGTDEITYTGKSGNTLTGVSGVTQTHTSGATAYIIGDTSNPAFDGGALSFFGTASDTNTDPWYITACIGTATGGSNAAPTCSLMQLCVSSTVSSGSSNSCSFGPLDPDTWEQSPFAISMYACDYNTNGACSSATDAYAYQNHRPELNSITETDTSSGSIEPGDTVRFTANITDSDTEGGADTVNLVICSDGSTFSSPSNPCNGGTTLCSSLNQAQGSLTCDASASITSIPTAHGNYGYEVFVYDEHEIVADYDPVSSAQAYAVTDVAPVVDSVTIYGNGNPGAPFSGSPAAGDTPAGSPSSAFTLTAAASTSFYWIATVHDNNGDGDLDTALTGRIFDAGASQTSTCIYDTGTNTNAQQECYGVTQAASACQLRAQSVVGSGKTATGTDQNAYVSCSAPVYFNANASAQWGAMVAIADGTTANVTGATSTNNYEVNALTAIDARDSDDASSPSLDFGALNPGQNTNTTNQNVYIANVGNQSFDTHLSATALCNDWTSAYTNCGGDSISVNQQKWYESAFDYDESGTAFSGSQVCLNNTVSVRIKDDNDSASDPIYFGMGLPTGTPFGSYTGQNTFSATVAPTTCD